LMAIRSPEDLITLGLLLFCLEKTFIALSP
jgi:hypothetical protein